MKTIMRKVGKCSSFFENDNHFLICELENQAADFFILSVHIVSVVKPKKKKVKGKMHKMCIPDLEGDGGGVADGGIADGVEDD